MRWCLIFLAACGRLGFGNACPDGTGHDEDGDGIDDACDGCPHLADPAQPDRDGDGVNDACDPHIDVPRDHIVLFDPFTSAQPGWIANGAAVPMYEGDRVVLLAASAGDPGFVRDGALGDDVIEVGVELLATGTTDWHQLELGGFGAPGAFYCELLDRTTPRFGAAYTIDGANYVTDHHDAQPLGAGAFRLTTSVTSTSIHCDTTFPTSATTADETLPPITATTFGIHGKLVDVALYYFIQIHSD